MGIRASLFWLGIILFLVATWWIFDLPSNEELRVIVKQWLDSYGLLILLVGAMLEALLLVGFYFPGSVLIFLGVGLAPSPIYAAQAVLAVCVGMLLGYAVNYFLGRYGWYKLLMKLGMKSGIENAQIKMEKNDIRYIAMTYWHPGLAAFTATAAGILKIGFKRFIIMSVIAVFAWNTLWGVFVYSLGEKAFALVEFKTVLFLISLWVLFELGMFLYRRKRSKVE